MSDTRIAVKEKPETKTRIASRCAADTGVTWRLAYDTLFKNKPIVSWRGELVYRWALEKRMFAPRDVAIRPPRKRSRSKETSIDVRKLLKNTEALIEGEGTTADVYEDTRREELEERAEAWKRFVAEQRAKEGAT